MKKGRKCFSKEIHHLKLLNNNNLNYDLTVIINAQNNLVHLYRMVRKVYLYNIFGNHSPYKLGKHEERRLPGWGVLLYQMNSSFLVMFQGGIIHCSCSVLVLAAYQDLPGTFVTLYTPWMVKKKKPLKGNELLMIVLVSYKEKIVSHN